MADPLEEYLSRKKGVPAGTSASADPLEAYLAAKAPKPVVPDAQVNRFPTLALDHPVEASNYDPGDLWRAGEAVANVAGDIKEHPLDTLKNPAKRHEFERGIADITTLGWGNKIADAASRSLQPQVPKALADLAKNPEAVKALERDPNWDPEREAPMAPGYRTGGQVFAMALPNLAGRQLGSLVKPFSAALPEAVGALPGAVTGAAKGVATYEATAPAMAGLAADSEGDRWGAMLRAAKNPMGIALGAGLGAFGGMAGGSANKIRDPRTQSGRDLQAIEAVNGEVRPFGEPARGGEFESPEMQNLPKGRAGRHELAAKSVDRVLGANDEQYHAAQEAWGNTADQVLADHGDETHFATKTHDVLDKLEQDNTVNGVVGDEKLAAAIKKARAMLQAPERESPVGSTPSAEPPPDVKQLLVLRAGAKSPMVRQAIEDQIKAAGGEVPTGPAANGNPADWNHQQWKLAADEWNGHHVSDADWERAAGGNPTGKPESATSELKTQKGGKALPKAPDKAAYAPTEQSHPDIPSPENATGVKVADFIKSRKVLNRMARNTQDPSERYAFGKILDAMKADAADIDPRIGKLNADYAKQMQSLTATNDALFGQAKPVVKVTEGVKQSAAARMDRIGEDTKPGMRAEPRMQRFAEARPSNAREAALNRAKQAAERLRYGEPQTSTGFEQSIARGAHKATASTIGAATGGALGHIPGAVAGYVGGKLLENLPQARVRIGLPVSEAIARNVTGSMAVPANRIMELSRARREEDRKRSAAMRNGAK
jgi:hypothetical protein